MIELPSNAKIRINGFYYRMVEPDYVREGDRVVDMRDGTHGICDMIHSDGNHIAIKDGSVIEVGVPISRIKLLDPIAASN